MFCELCNRHTNWVAKYYIIFKVFKASNDCMVGFPSFLRVFAASIDNQLLSNMTFSILFSSIL